MAQRAYGHAGQKNQIPFLKKYLMESKLGIPNWPTFQTSHALNGELLYGRAVCSASHQMMTIAIETVKAITRLMMCFCLGGLQKKMPTKKQKKSPKGVTSPLVSASAPSASPKRQAFFMEGTSRYLAQRYRLYAIRATNNASTLVSWLCIKRPRHPR